MFLESGYKGVANLPEESNISVYDVSILLAHIGTKPILKINHSDAQLKVKHLHLTSFWIQGMFLAKNEMPLFSSNFEVVDGHIESPEIRHLFGNWDDDVTPFNTSDHIKSLLAPASTGYSLKDNLFVQKIAWERFPMDQESILKELLTSELEGKASSNNGIISKAEIKSLFEKMLKKEIMEFDPIEWSQDSL